MKVKRFSNEDFGEIRVINIDDNPWFVGKDVAKILGYSNSRKAILDHVFEDDRKMILKSQNVTLDIPNRGLIVINEAGLYSLIFSSKMPTARFFKQWVTQSVLPSIYRSGGYILGQEALSLDERTALEEKIKKISQKVAVETEKKKRALDRWHIVCGERNRLKVEKSVLKSERDFLFKDNQYYKKLFRETDKRNKYLEKEVSDIKYRLFDFLSGKGFFKSKDSKNNNSDYNEHIITTTFEK